MTKKIITNKDVLKKLEEKFPGIGKDIQKELSKLKLAHKIAELRQKKGLSQKELGRRIGMEQSNLARLESASYRDYRVSTLQKIAKATGTNLIINFI